MPSLKTINIYNAIDWLISASFILLLGTTSISNNSHQNLTLKLISVILFGILTSLRVKIIYGLSTRSTLAKLQNDLEQFLSRKIIWITVGSFAIITLSLTYSENLNYGIWKLTNITLIIFPPVILFMLNIINRPAILLKNFLKVTEIFLLVSSILILVMQPFDYLGEEYKLSIERWSHVVTGRVHGFLFLFYFLYASFIKKKVRTKEYVIILVSGLGLYFIGLRAATLGVMILLPVILSLMYFVRRNIRNVVRLSLPIAATIIIILFIGNINEPAERLYRVGEFLIYNEVDDGAINARLEGWMVGWEMIKDSPFIGRGLGGYNSDFRDHEIQKVIKYPHNLFIELVVELGILGCMVIILIIGFIIVNLANLRICELKTETTNFNLVLFFLVIFSLWMAMFSKDISSQSLLWVSMGILSFQQCYQLKEMKNKEAKRELIL